MDKTDLLALYLSGTYCRKTSTRPPSCQLLDNWLYILPDTSLKLSTFLYKAIPLKAIMLLDCSNLAVAILFVKSTELIKKLYKSAVVGWPPLVLVVITYIKVE